MINNQSEFIQAYADSVGLSADRSALAQIKRNVYKYTDCGAWIEFAHDKIVLGSIVEGCEIDVGPFELVYPFEYAEFDATLTEIEAEADILWHEFNG